MKKVLFSILCTIAIPVIGQQKKDEKTPLFVSHLSKENAAVTRRKDAPSHFFLTRVICFQKKCRAYIGWRDRQRSDRYDYKAASKKIRRDQKKLDTTTVKQDKPIQKMAPKKPALVLPVLSNKSDSTIVLNEVLFEINSYKLKEDLKLTLDSIAIYLRKQSMAAVNISGHTDNTGKEDYNITLSSQRAESVAEYLLERGLNPDRVSYVGLGSSVPIQPNDSPEGRRKNRRVEILIRWKN